MSTPAENHKAQEYDVIRLLRDRLEIEALAVAYARGTDAIARGNVDEGRRLYAECFTEDAVIEASYPDNDPSGPPDMTAHGPAMWAEHVFQVFSGQGYTATQHLLGSFSVDVRGDAATMQCYLHATHVLGARGPVDVAHGTYVDQAVRTPQGWKIAHRTLRLVDFLRLQGAAT